MFYVSIHYAIVIRTHVYSLIVDMAIEHARVLSIRCVQYISGKSYANAKSRKMTIWYYYDIFGH